MRICSKGHINGTRNCQMCGEQDIAVLDNSDRSGMLASMRERQVAEFIQLLSIVSERIAATKAKGQLGASHSQYGKPPYRQWRERHDAKVVAQRESQRRIARKLQVA